MTKTKQDIFHVGAEVYAPDRDGVVSKAVVLESLSAQCYCAFDEYNEFVFYTDQRLKLR